MKHDGETVKWEDAAAPVTASGWECVKCHHFYGDNERAARYCCHTDAPCKCGARKKRHEVSCEGCWHKQKIERWNGLEQVSDALEPSSDSPWALLDGDEYFFDAESFIEHCEQHEVKPSEVFPVLCKPHNPPAFNLSEWLDDYLPGEEREMVGDADEIRAIEKSVDDFSAKHSPMSWYPDHKRRPKDSVLAVMDKVIEETAT